MAVTTENLPQLYRFCFLMTGDAAKAQAAFQDTVREAATRAASDEEIEISPTAPMQIQQLEPAQLALWISAAPEPQRSAMALFYLDEFSLAELLALLELKAGEFSELICSGRRQFQSWLDSTFAYYEGETFDAGQV